MEDLLPAVASLGAGRDFRQGKAFFTQAMGGTCHALGEHAPGHGFSPNLTGVGSKDSRDLILESILKPSAVLNGQYYTTLFRPKNGEVAQANSEAAIFQKTNLTGHEQPLGQIRRLALETLTDAARRTLNWRTPGRPGGRGGPGGFNLNLPGLNEAQRTAMREFNDTLAARNQTLVTARASLNSATFANKPDGADIQRQENAVAAAELELAQARAESFAKMQASPGRLTAPQVEAQSQQRAAGGAGSGRGGGRGPGGGSSSPRGSGNPAFDASVHRRNEEIRKWRTSR